MRFILSEFIEQRRNSWTYLFIPLAVFADPVVKQNCFVEKYFNIYKVACKEFNQ